MSSPSSLLPKPTLVLHAGPKAWSSSWAVSKTAVPRRPSGHSKTAGLLHRPGALSFQRQHLPPRQAFAAAGFCCCRVFVCLFVFDRSCVPQPSLPSAGRGLLSCLRHPEGPRRLNTDPEHNRSTKSCRVKFRSIRYCHIHQWRTQRQPSLGTNNASFSSSEVFPPSVKPTAKDKYG